MNYSIFVLPSFLICSFISQAAQSQSLFDLSFGYNPVTGQSGGGAQSFSSSSNALAALTVGGLQQIDPTYRGSEQTQITLNYRGVSGALVTTSVNAGQQVTVTFPNQPTRVFTDPTLDGALAQASTYISTVFPNLSSTLVATTGTDYVAGNPQSLQTNMMKGDSRLGGFGANQLSFKTAGAGGSILPAQFGVGANFGKLSGGGVELEYLELPFSYAKPLADPRYALVLEAPLSYTKYNGTDIMTLSFGGGVRMPVTDDWYITPTARFGTNLSGDFELDASLFGLSVVSDYSFLLGDLDVSVGNQISHVRTVSVLDNDYDVQNTIFKNGATVSGPTRFDLFGLGVTWEASVANTIFTGDNLFVENMTEAAVSLGTTNSRNGVQWDSFRIGITQMFTDTDIGGTEINFGYKF